MSAFKDEEVISKYKDIRDIAKTFGASDYQANISAINKVVSDSKVGTFFSNIQKGATLATSRRIPKRILRSRSLSGMKEVSAVG